MKGPFIPLFALIIALASCSSWTDCGAHSDKFKLATFTIFPDPPVPGEKMYANISGTVYESVTNALMTLHVDYNGETALTNNTHICAATAGGCAAGPFSHQISAQLTPNFPWGNYTGRSFIYDQNSLKIACVELDFYIPI